MTFYKRSASSLVLATENFVSSLWATTAVHSFAAWRTQSLEVLSLFESLLSTQTLLIFVLFPQPDFNMRSETVS